MHTPVVGEVIEARAYESVLSPDDVEAEALALGKQWLLQGRLRSPESISVGLFASAVSLAANRDLLEPTADSIEARLAFATELGEIVQRLQALESLEAAYIAGVVD